jgi:hypothetical protein
MPRPKPPEPLIGRQVMGKQVRMSDRHWIIFNHLGGAQWLRELLDKKDPFPKKYYEGLKNDDRNRESKTGTTTQGAGAR